jgi:hypothetical protein
MWGAWVLVKLVIDQSTANIAIKPGILQHVILSELIFNQ